jgi:hypothetical protein
MSGRLGVIRVTFAAAIAATAILLTAGISASAPVSVIEVNCYPPNARSITPVLLERAHPELCALQGEPESEADLLQLTAAHWSGWGTPAAVTQARALNNQPGMGGPASYPVHVTLSDIRRGCHGHRFYTRARVSSSYGTGQLRLTDTCRAIPGQG